MKETFAWHSSVPCVCSSTSATHQLQLPFHSALVTRLSVQVLHFTWEHISQCSHSKCNSYPINKLFTQLCFTATYMYIHSVPQPFIYSELFVQEESVSPFRVILNGTGFLQSWSWSSPQCVPTKMVTGVISDLSGTYMTLHFYSSIR